SRLDSRWPYTSDMTVDFVQRVTNRKICRDFRERKSRSLRRQRTATPDTWIHLDHHHAASVRMDRKLDIRATGHDADLANDCERSVTHHLIFLISKRLHGGDRDGVASMHSHGIEVLD